jgi:NADH-ubiquinone oxidoreductase chain 5
MYLNLIWLPLGGALAAGLGGRWVGPNGACRLSLFSVTLAAIFSLVAAYEVSLQGSPCFFKICPWVDSDLLNVSWGFLFDSLTTTMLVVVTFISTLVHLYSTDYIGEDPHLPRFISYLSLFTFFMLILVTSDNFLQIFVGWEGVGLCSYLLINFWFTRIQANKAAIKAIIVNRIGDFGLCLGILALWTSLESLDYATAFAVAPALKNQSLCFGGVNWDALNLIGVLLFVGAVGKSAQLGLHTWLPDAIEGPTPVSALIHAATIVTAGVFLLGRCSPLLEYAELALFVVTIVGAITAFFAATTGLVQNDLKRVIAYSTCSQLGYIIFACGLSNYSVGIFHLANHAFFKALLFLGAGSVIHGVADEQDIRKIGGLRRLLPFTYAIIVIGSFALIGLPFLTGFYSKDVILEIAYGSFCTSGQFAYVLGAGAAFFTAFYSLRLVCLTFLSSPNGSRPVIVAAHDSKFPIALPLAILAVPSIFLGYLIKDLFLGLGTPYWNNSLFILPSHFTMIEAEFLPTSIKLLPVIFSIFGGVLAFFLYSFNSKKVFEIKIQFKTLYTFLNRKWFFDKIYNEYINQTLLNTAYHFTYKAVDRGIIEILGPYGLSKITIEGSSRFKNLQTGAFYHSALGLVIGVLGILGIFIFPIELGSLFLVFSLPLII